MILGNRTLGYPDPGRFAEIKEQLIRNWDNQSKARPISQLFNQLTSLLQPNNPPFEQLLRHLRTVELEEMPGFVAQLFGEVHVEALVHGDWTAAEALELAALMERHLSDINGTSSKPSGETRRPLISIQDGAPLFASRVAITKTRRSWSTTNPAPPERGISPASLWRTTSCPLPSSTSCAPASNWGMWWAPATCPSIAIRA